MTIANFVSKHRLVRIVGRFALLLACASALVLSSASPAFAALSCSAANVTLNYGAYDVLAGTALNGAGTITVSCTKSGPTAAGNVSYEVALTPLTPRQLAPPSGTDRLSHQLYLDSARTAQPWGDGTGGTFVITGTFSVPKNSTRSDVPKNFYAAVTPGGQDVSAASPGPPPTTYMQTFTVTVTCTVPAGGC